MIGGTRSYEFGKRLANNGHEVHIITSDLTGISKAKSRWTTEKIDGMTIHWLNCHYANDMGFYRRIWAFMYFAIHTSMKGLQIKGDLVFATSTPLTIAIPGIFLSKLKRMPMVFEVRDLWPELPIAIGALNNPVLKYLARKLEKIAYASSECVIALSPGMKAGVIATGYDSNRVAVIPNSSDDYFKNPDPQKIDSFRQQRAWLDNGPLVVYTGTFGKINGVGYLVELAAAVKKINANINFLIVGGGMEFEEVKNKAIKYDVLDDNVHIESTLKKNDVPVVLSLATVATSLFIDLPEMESNSANKFFDALASGTPVFINYGGWQHELVTTNNLGLAVKGMTIPMAAQTLCDFLQNENQLKISSTEASRVARDLFNRDLLAVKFQSILEAGYSKQGDSAHTFSYSA